MPLYEYRCQANGRLVEVRHSMAERLASWGEVCERAGICTGDTDPGAPVEKLISAGYIGTAPAAAAGGCTGGGCGSGLCGAGEF